MTAWTPPRPSSCWSPWGASPVWAAWCGWRRVSDKRPKQYRKIRLELPVLFEEKLKTLTKANLTRELGAYLHPKQIEAIIKRRDRILDEAVRTGFKG